MESAADRLTKQVTKGFTISQVGKKAHVNIDTLRYYERQGLIDAPPRTAANYRVYSPDTVDLVRFIKQAQQLGFTLKEIKELLNLRANPGAMCADARRNVEAKVKAIKEQIFMLQSIHKELVDLLQKCPGEAPVCECPILQAIDSKAKA